MNTQHKDLAAGKWLLMSLAEQMGNIGSEIHRLVLAKDDIGRRDAALDRCIELIDLTLADRRWVKGYKEIARVREVLCDIYFGDNQYQTSIEDLDEYFFQFALIAR